MNTSNPTTSIFRIIRNCMNLTLNEMADKCDVSAIYLSELERGVKTNPSDEFIQKFETATGVTARTIKYFFDNPRTREFYRIHFMVELEKMAIRGIVIDKHNMMRAEKKREV